MYNLMLIHNLHNIKILNTALNQLIPMLSIGDL